MPFQTEGRRKSRRRSDALCLRLFRLRIFSGRLQYGLCLLRFWFIKKEKKSYKWINSEVENANRKRKLAQMYNQIANGKGQKYSFEELQQVYDYIHSENNKYRAMYKENKYEEYLTKQRDETVFEKFNLKKEG